jgi:methyl-accepting chemotaxis protein
VAAGFDPAVGDQAVQGADRQPSKLLAEIGAANVKDQAAAIERVSAQAKQATLISLALMAVSCVLAGVVAWLVTRSLTGPIARAVKVAETVAAGDLTRTSRWRARTSRRSCWPRSSA